MKLIDSSFGALIQYAGHVCILFLPPCGLSFVKLRYKEALNGLIVFTANGYNFGQFTANS